MAVRPSVKTSDPDATAVLICSLPSAVTVLVVASETVLVARDAPSGSGRVCGALRVTWLWSAADEEGVNGRGCGAPTVAIGAGDAALPMDVTD